MKTAKATLHAKLLSDYRRRGIVLDPGIRDYVLTLNAAGIRTRWSCDGLHAGAAYPEPTIELEDDGPYVGNSGVGMRAYVVAVGHHLPVTAVRLTYPIDPDTRLPGAPYWELALDHPQRRGRAHGKVPDRR